MDITYLEVTITNGGNDESEVNDGIIKEEQPL